MKKQKQKGITLVALVITIIILLILAGISIMSLTNTGIFGKAQEAKEKSAEAEKNQKATLDEYETELNKFLTASDIAKAENKSEIYGKKVEYKPAGVTTDVGWKIFYSDGENIYLIADNYVEREALPESTKDGVRTGHKPNDGNKLRAAYFANIIDDYTGSDNISNTRLRKLNNSFFSQGFTSTYNNMRSVAYMMDTTAWKGYKDKEGKADYAIGGPTIEMLMNSYSQSHNVQYKAKATNDTGYPGYKISADNGNNWLTYCVEMLSISDNLYIVNSTSNANAMWIASPSAYIDNYIMYASGVGSIYIGTYEGTNLGFRPLICLDSKVILQETNGTYTIQ